MTAGSENVYMLVLVDPATSDALKCQTRAQKLSDRLSHMVVKIEPSICKLLMTLDTTDNKCSVRFVSSNQHCTEEVCYRDALGAADRLAEVIRPHAAVMIYEF